MKISKLFHWLYASVMFLPLFFLLPTALYYGFNEHSVAQEKIIQEPVYYDTNNITTLDDILIGNAYKWLDNYTPSGTFNGDLLQIKVLSGTLKDQIGIFYVTPSGNVAFRTNSYTNVNLLSFDFAVENKYNDFSNIPLVILEKITSCTDKYIKEYQEITYSMSITDSISNAWQDIWDLPMFTWTSNTFFSAPFTYIADLFGIEATNPLCNALSYWFSISIIWLTFDLFIYVPLLVHRWLDKGVLE